MPRHIPRLLPGMPGFSKTNEILFDIAQSVEPETVEDVGMIRRTVGTTLVEIFPADSRFTIITDTGNSDIIFARFGNIPAETSGPFQGIPLAPGQSITNKDRKVKTRITLISSSADQIVYYVPLLSLEFRQSQTSKTFNGDAQAIQSLNTQFVRPTLFNRVDSDWVRATAYNGIAQTSATAATNIVTFFVPNNKQGSFTYTRTATTWEGNRVLAFSLDNFTTTLHSITQAMPGGAITTGAEFWGLGDSGNVGQLADQSANAQQTAAGMWPFVRVTLAAQTGEESVIEATFK